MSAVIPEASEVKLTLLIEPEIIALFTEPEIIEVETGLPGPRGFGLPEGYSFSFTHEVGFVTVLLNNVAIKKWRLLDL